MNQRTEEGRKPYAARFVVCPNCGLHGEIVIDGVPESADYPVPMPNQGEVRSQEKAIMQAAGLLTDGFIDVNGFRNLLQQILETELSPTERLVPEWVVRSLLLQVSEDFGPLMASLDGMSRTSRPAPSRG